MIAELTRDSIARHFNAGFHVERPGAGTGTLECVEASDVRSSGSDETFSIVFLPQAAARCLRDAIGTFDRSIMPIRGDQRGFCCEAVFNRLRRGHGE